MCFLHKSFFAFLLVLRCQLCWAQPLSDTTKLLQEVVVTDAQKRVVSVQSFTRKEIEKLNTTQLGEVVKNFSGVMVKDYGGLGGIKAISVRSLGAHHTAVSYDGIVISDMQTGVIDLGRFPVDGIKSVDLYQGQMDILFVPARHFASASVLNLQTIGVDTTSKERFRVGTQVGSFGFVNPYLFHSQQLSSKLWVSNSFSFQHTDGNYPFTLKNGVATKEATRTNSDLSAYLAESNWYYQATKKQHIDAKIYYYDSDRGVPGAVIYYTDAGRQRLSDQVLMLQGKHKWQISNKVHQKTSFKYSHAYEHYSDPDWLGALPMNNKYWQQEWYASVVHWYELGNRFSASHSVDYAYNDLSSNMSGFVSPKRQTVLGNVAFQYADKYVRVMSNLLSSSFFNEVKSGNTAKDYNKLSPAIYVNYSPFINHCFTIKAFYKDIFRMPTFNDLYYTLVGNRNLKPENVKQYSLGLSYEDVTDHISWLASVDVYKNYVDNKIVAYPSGNLFSWTMLNLNKVEVTGIDANARFAYKFSKIWIVATDVMYTYQKTIDVSNPESQTYRNQVAYTPLHSGGGGLSVDNSKVGLSYRFLWSGYRYSSNQNIQANYLSGYGDHSVSVWWKFNYWKLPMQLGAECLNLYNQQYEVVKNYPMPGRNYRVKVQFKF